MVLILALNQPPPEDDDGPDEEPVAFEVPPPPPPPKVKRKPPPRRTQRVKAPPAPMVGASLAGLDLGFSGADLLGDLSGGLLGDTSGVVMTEDSVDSPPEPSQTVAVTYPSRARAQGVTGQVDLRVLVTAGGRVKTVKVERATPPGVFDEVAVEAVKRWTFEPGTYHGVAVDAWLRVRIPFQLDDIR